MACEFKEPWFDLRGADINTMLCLGRDFATPLIAPYVTSEGCSQMLLPLQIFIAVFRASVAFIGEKKSRGF